MNPTRTVIVDDPLNDRARQLQAAVRRALAVPGKTTFAPLAGAQVTRMRLMYAALRDGLELGPEVRYWPALAPLKAGKHGINEREGVLRERDRLLELAPAERSAELLAMAAHVTEARS